MANNTKRPGAIGSAERAVYDLPMATGYQLVCNGIGVFFNRTQVAADIKRISDSAGRCGLCATYRDSALVRLTIQSAPPAAPHQNLLDLLRQQAKQMEILQP
ncbi:MAG: hypothetical protein R2867_40240 [Caldilineaceae bacterium]